MHGLALNCMNCLKKNSEVTVKCFFGLHSDKSPFVATQKLNIVFCILALIFVEKTVPFSGTIVPATDQTLWKRRSCADYNEGCAYRVLMRDSALDGFVPHYYREVEYKNESNHLLIFIRVTVFCFK